MLSRFLWPSPSSRLASCEPVWGGPSRSRRSPLRMRRTPSIGAAVSSLQEPSPLRTARPFRPRPALLTQPRPILLVIGGDVDDAALPRQLRLLILNCPSVERLRRQPRLQSPFRLPDHDACVCGSSSRVPRHQVRPQPPQRLHRSHRSALRHERTMPECSLPVRV